MKPHANHRSGFTLLEMLISLTAYALVGAIVFEILRLGLVLHTKNIALNISHQQARMALDWMTKDINSAISVPTLTDTNFNAVANPDAGAAGIEFLKMSGTQPFEVYAPQNVSGSQIKIITGSFMPVAGEWLIIPSYSIQQSISSVTAGSGGVNTLLLSSPLSSPVSITGTTNVVAYIADQVGYTINNGQLLYYPSTAGNNSYVIARDIVTGSSSFFVPTN